MIEELTRKYDVGEDVDLEAIEEFQTGELRKLYKLAKRAPQKAKTMANSLLYDEEGPKEKCCQAIFNFLICHIHPSSSNYNEDIFTKKFVTPLLSPFFEETKYLKQFGNDEESEGSKERRGKFGRRSDRGLKIVSKE
ncbi:hypothetical protein CLU79DRAFT_747311 [Phycomyces nitens]|nr:hypothetical protein CLU79DRAFT_747311 [Phycomyces nitens]